MQIKKAIAPIAVLAVAGALLVGSNGANAADSSVVLHHMLGYAGGTSIQALGKTVQSNFTSESAVDFSTSGSQCHVAICPTDGDANTLATAVVPDVATVTAVGTSTLTYQINDAVQGPGVEIVSSARTAGINLLGGAIVANAVTTVDTAILYDNGHYTWNVQTEFVGLKIAGVRLPVTIPANFHVILPNIATVVLNAGFAGAGPIGSGSLMTEGAGLYLSLLQGRGPSPLGTVIFLNPTYAAISNVSPQTGDLLAGYAFGSEATAHIGTLLNIYSGPTAQYRILPGGTNGVTQMNTTATVTVPSLLTAGVITDTGQALKSNTQPNFVTMTTNLARLNVLGGLITADALSGTAHVQDVGGVVTSSATVTSFINLKVAGLPITINCLTNPGQQVNIAGLGTLTLCAHSAAAPSTATTTHGAFGYARTVLLDLKITTSNNYKLAIGAEVIIGEAVAMIQTPVAH